MSFLPRTVEGYARLGAGHTAREIGQQPVLWRQVLAQLYQHKNTLQSFIKKHVTPSTKVVFTGAGTSEFVGNTVVPYLKKRGLAQVSSLASTDIVAAPHSFVGNDNILLISCARSGDSPESVATVQLVDQLATKVAHILITCNQNGQLARQARQRDDSYLFLLEDANDQGFAMTGSFTCMTMAAASLLRLDALPASEPFDRWCEQVETMLGAQAPVVSSLASQGKTRFISLGSAANKGLAQEAQLKVIELSGSLNSGCFDTPLGFRHGPKSLLNDNSLVWFFVSSDPHTLKYEIDLLNELRHTAGQHYTLVVSPQKLDLQLSNQQIVLPPLPAMGLDYLHGLAAIVLAQTYALENSLRLGIRADNPSPSGSVNRVVQGVTIYPYPEVP